MAPMTQKLDLQQTMTPLTAQKCYVNVVYDYDHTVGKNARSSKTKNREHANFFDFMDVSYGIN